MLVKPLNSIGLMYAAGGHCPPGACSSPALLCPGAPHLPARPQKPVSGHPGYFLPRGPPPSSDPSSPVQAGPRPVTGKQGSRSRLFTLVQRQGDGVTWGPPTPTLACQLHELPAVGTGGRAGGIPQD